MTGPDPDRRRAEHALHQRIGLACAAARAEAVPGSFRVWEQAGVRAVVATDPALGFLCTLSGVGPDTLPAAIELAAQTAGSTLVLTDPPDQLMQAQLRAANLVPAGERALALRTLDRDTGDRCPAMFDADGDPAFLPVLLAGYQVHGVLAAFVRAEHRLPGLLRFLATEGGTPIAAAGLTIHEDVAVLGGASTLPACRGRGAQSRLLRHRLRVAAEAGCTLAVATARPDSVSEANLRRAGFRIHRRPAWARGQPSHSVRSMA